MQMSLKQEVEHLHNWFNRIRVLAPNQKREEIRDQLSDRSARGDVYWIEAASGERWLPRQASRIPKQVWNLPPGSYPGQRGESGQWWHSAVLLNTQNLFLNDKGEWLEVRRLGALSYDTDLWVARDARLLRDLIYRYVLIAAGVLACMLLIAFLLSRILARRLILPIEALNLRASQASPEQLILLGDQFADSPLELEKLSNSFDAMMVRIADQYARQRSFVRHVSHELQAPLTVIRGYLQRCLRKADQIPAPVLKSIHVAEEEAGRMVDLVSDLLDLSRLEAASLQLCAEPCDVHALVMGAAERMSKAFGRQVSFAVQPSLLDEQGCCQAVLDQKRVQQIVVNLLENAFKYSEPWSAVDLELAADSDWLLLRVIDRGIGVPESEREHLFEPFHRASNAQSHAGGTGLGLSVCRLMLQAMSGSIELERSDLGQGSVFLVRLPFRRPGA